nr:LIM domain transcription factor LMO4.2-like [Nerophis lumbriciformis]
MVNSQASGVTPAPRSCAGCGGKIADRFLLFSMERYWHNRCLKCSCCQAQLGDIGTTCYSKGGMILCRSDYIRLFGHSGACSACGQSIPANEMVMRAQGNVYHLKCFSCATCRNRLMPGDRFHYLNGTIFCEHDRPGAALLSSHLPQLQSNSVLTDQKRGLLASITFIIRGATQKMLSDDRLGMELSCKAATELVIRHKYEGVEGTECIVYELSEVDHHRESHAKAKVIRASFIDWGSEPNLRDSEKTVTKSCTFHSTAAIYTSETSPLAKGKSPPPRSCTCCDMNICED